MIAIHIKATPYFGIVIGDGLYMYMRMRECVHCPNILYATVG